MMNLVETQAGTSRSARVRVALIGAGKHGLAHVHAIGLLQNAELVAIADPAATEEALRPLLPKTAKIFTDPQTMLAETKPDAVHIVTPPHTHVPLAKLVLEAGAHVYVEKPFAPTREETDEILALANAKGLKVCAGHQCLFEKPALMALEGMQDIGRIVHIESYFAFNKVRRTITSVDQAKDILPHAVYPLVEQLRAGSGLSDGKIEFKGIDARSTGDVYALLRLGDCTGILQVTLSGRPVEQYQHIIGTNGSIRADYITDSVTKMIGPGAGPGKLFTPYRRAWQGWWGATRGFAGLIFGKTSSYRGLQVLFGRFYQSILDKKPSPLSPQSISDTVHICEVIGQELDRVEALTESVAQTRLAAAEAAMPPPTREAVLVTGGTGLLGRAVVKELRHAGYAVRAISRRAPPPSERVAGVEYMRGDLARGLDPATVQGCGLIVHCAAETAGAKQEHERNSIAATRGVIEAAAKAGVKKVIQISSLAVLVPGHTVRGPLNEQTPVDAGNLERGPYVWGKAESEVLAQKVGKELGVDVKIIRPGPLVDYNNFHPPGRLGREAGPVFVAIGGKRSELSVLDIWAGARVIRLYAEDFASAPPVLNLIEGPPPTRAELLARYRKHRPDLGTFWIPAWLLRFVGGTFKLQHKLRGKDGKPMDIYAAFASERYDTRLAASLIQKAGPSSINEPASTGASVH